ncbi:MAG: adenylyl-sulfate kinase [Candidatus Omnitrophica bacterium]|nr:adenylyl-sulfate kinase [Candidatus Omnitrophota bacterium]MDD5352408.1 adenylyl-sulfate kinase [Candidatus Omnitrophota bacterium]MDD5550006.1 adenylyl-sulfate kinase [Candidatus Omnitrophota bacterium]
MLNKKTLVFWFTGLSGSGKTTIANETKKSLSKIKKKIKIYDGDIVRQKLNRHLKFTPKHIKKNNRIIAEICKQEINKKKYDYIFVTVISPFEESRQQVKSTIGEQLYLIYCKASLGTVIKRDPKGLYKKALSGKIENFIGIDKNVPYQMPKNADLVLDTEKYDLKTCIKKLISFIKTKEI